MIRSLKSRRRFVGAAAAALLAVVATSAAPAPAARADVLPVRKSALVVIPSRLEVKAPPARVWAALTSVKGFCALTGFTPDAASKGHAFARLGDHARAGIWSDRGTLVVTGWVPMKELRVAWEPENASYVCEKRILLAKTAAGTSLDILDRYSDDQPKVDETAKKSAEETGRALEAFRVLVERK